MIIEYHRPDSLEEALELLARAEPVTLPLGGGLVLNQPSPEPVAVVDLQLLGLNQITPRGKQLEIGASVTLADLGAHPEVPSALAQAISLETTHNRRQVATVAGTLVAADGRSPFTTAMLALDAKLSLASAREEFAQDISLGNFLPQRPERLRLCLITRVTIPLHARLAYHSVARSPMDQPLVCAAVAQWPSGRTRVALGGYDNAPRLALDGPDAEGAEAAASSAYLQAEDEWASAAYRSEMAAVLVKRCLVQIKER
jgi:CO/xanthine dehydrogenase FAD-binding subunit